MKTHLNTLEDICFNNLMPWLEHNSDTEQFDEIIRAIDISTIKDHQMFFLHLIEYMNITGTVITASTLHEWKHFSGIRRNKKIKEMTNQLSSFIRRDAKLSFYTLLISKSVSAIMSSLQEQMAIFTSKPLKKQLVDKYITRLRRVIEANNPVGDHSENDLLIIKFTKLGALSIYILLLLEYKKFIHPYNELTHNDIMTAFALISMADHELSKNVSALLKVYKQIRKSNSRTPGNNKPKESPKKTTLPPDEKEVTNQEHERLRDTNKDAVETSNDVNQYYTSTQVMKILSVNKTTLKRYRDKHELPYIRIGEKGKFLYPIKKFNTWLEKNSSLFIKQSSQINQ